MFCIFIIGIGICAVIAGAAAIGSTFFESKSHYEWMRDDH